MNLADRFWCKVARGGPNECWPWQAYRQRGGYGRICVKDGRRQPIQYAHRVAWEITHGDPGAAYVLHRCDNPACCNPAHLFLGTQADNMRDRDAKGRQVPARGARNGRAKLCESAVAEIRRLSAEDGLSHRGIAARFAVSPSTVGDILRGESWRPNA